MISTVICTYNRSHCICKAISSVLDQDSPDAEVIVVNDGSKDDTTRVVTSMFGDRVRLICCENGGLPVARNIGIAAARGDWVAFLDDDDWWPKGKLERQKEAIAKYPDVVAVASNIQFDEARGGGSNLYEMRGLDHLLGTMSRLERPLQFVVRGCVLPSALIVRRDILQETGGFSHGRHIKLEDLDCFWRVALKGAWATVDDPRVNMCRNDGIDASYSESLLRQGRLGLWMDLAQRCRDMLNDSRLSVVERRVVNRRLALALLELSERFNRFGHNRLARRYACSALLKHYPGRLWLRVIGELAFSLKKNG